ELSDGRSGGGQDHGLWHRDRLRCRGSMIQRLSGGPSQTPATGPLAAALAAPTRPRGGPLAASVAPQMDVVTVAASPTDAGADTFAVGAFAGEPLEGPELL